MRAQLLLFGMPRSGTTWIGKIFDSHPDTVYLHEPDTWRAIRQVPLAPDLEDSDRYRGVVQDYVASLCRSRSVRVWGKLPLFPKSYLSTPRLWALRGSIAAAKITAKCSLELPVIGLPENGAAHVVWKSIESLGRLGVFMRCLTSARAIHIIRHPCGYVASVLRGEAQRRFVSRTPASEDFGIFEILVTTRVAKELELTLEGLKRMRAHERLAWRWLVFNEKAGRELSGCERYTRVVYEDVCGHALAQSRALIEFAGLRWEEQTATFIEASTGRSDDDYYGVRKDPQAAADRWRADLSPAVVDDVLAIAQRAGVGRLFGAR